MRVAFSSRHKNLLLQFWAHLEKGMGKQDRLIPTQATGGLRVQKRYSVVRDRRQRQWLTAGFRHWWTGQLHLKQYPCFTATLARDIREMTAAHTELKNGKGCFNERTFTKKNKKIKPTTTKYRKTRENWERRITNLQRFSWRQSEIYLSS